jgi:hypothetical protein
MGRRFRAPKLQSRATAGREAYIPVRDTECSPDAEAWVKCPQCDTQHELLEPAFGRPDQVFRLPREDRASRVDEDDDMCRMRVSLDSEVPAAYQWQTLAVRFRPGQLPIPVGISVRPAQNEQRAG